MTMNTSPNASPDTTYRVADMQPIGHREATELARHQYAQLASAFAHLDDADWGRPTDCEGWTVRHLAGHVVGAMRAAASVRENMSQLRTSMRRAKNGNRPLVDELTALQIERTADLEPADLVVEMQDLVESAATGRRRTPAPVRRIGKMTVEVPGLTERWTVGYLVDTILTRDTFMHRIDLARAVDAELRLDTDEDRRVVADIAREWAVRHGEPVRLVLTGAAGGTFVAGGRHDDGDELTLDAVEFCRIVSTRVPGEGLLAQPVPF